MNENYGSDFITLEDEDGSEFELEHIDTLEHNDETYMLFLPADMDEDDPDFGFVILKVTEENGEELLGSIDDDDELNAIYDIFMARMFADEGEDAQEEDAQEEDAPEDGQLQ